MRHAAFVLFVLLSACGPEVETHYGKVLCETVSDCDDDNPCTEDSCESGTCNLIARPEGSTCTEDGTTGTCSLATCAN